MALRATIGLGDLREIQEGKSIAEGRRERAVHSFNKDSLRAGIMEGAVPGGTGASW